MSVKLPRDSGSGISAALASSFSSSRSTLCTHSDTTPAGTVTPHNLQPRHTAALPRRYARDVRTAVEGRYLSRQQVAMQVNNTGADKVHKPAERETWYSERQDESGL
jgi:hypothetical protein